MDIIMTDLVKQSQEENLDLHKLYISKKFGIAYDEVTPEQRQQGIALLFGWAYGSETLKGD